MRSGTSCMQRTRFRPDGDSRMSLLTIVGNASIGNLSLTTDESSTGLPSHHRCFHHDRVYHNRVGHSASCNYQAGKTFPLQWPPVPHVECARQPIFYSHRLTLAAIHVGSRCLGSSTDQCHPEEANQEYLVAMIKRRYSFTLVSSEMGSGRLYIAGRRRQLATSSDAAAPLVIMAAN